ncbi:MAG: hypothetical protein U1C97_02210, partial [Candidatus Gracilibacteria bacterium]|nr:hypothetical protein [Candidatus Gracilibacteria bacterium]
SANVEIKSFPTSAQYRKEILVLEELIEAAHGQGKADTDSEVKALLDLKKAYTQVEINIRHQEALFGNLAFDLNDEIDWVSSGVGKLAGEKTGITAKETMMDIKDWVKKSLTPPSMGDDVGKWFGFTVKALGAATAVIGAFKMGKSLIHVLTGGGQGRWGSFKDILKTGTLTTLVAGGMVVAGNAISDPKAAEKKAREWAGIVKGEGEAAYETARAHLTPDAAANLAFVSLKVTEADRKKLIVENPARSDFDKMMWKKENLALKPEEWESLHRLLGPWVKEKFGVDVKDYQKHLECMRDFQQEVLKGMKIDITAGSNREISIDFQKWNTFLSDTYVQSNADPNNPQDYLFSVEQLSGLGFLLPAEKTQATTNRMASFRPSHELQKTMIKQGLWLKRLNTPPTPPSPPSP